MAQCIAKPIVNAQHSTKCIATLKIAIIKFGKTPPVTYSLKRAIQLHILTLSLAKLASIKFLKNV